MLVTTQEELDIANFHKFGLLLLPHLQIIATEIAVSCGESTTGELALLH